MYSIRHLRVADGGLSEPGLPFQSGLSLSLTRHDFLRDSVEALGGRFVSVLLLPRPGSHLRVSRNSRNRPIGYPCTVFFGTDVWYLSIDHAATTRIVPKSPSPIRMVRRDAKRQHPTRRGSSAWMGMIDPQRLTAMPFAYPGASAAWIATVPKASLRTSTLTRPAFSMRAESSSTVRNPCTDSGR